MHDFRGGMLAALKSFSSDQLNAEAPSKAASLSRGGGSGGGGDLPRFALPARSPSGPESSSSRGNAKATDC
jgi:hypothetical protein